MTAITLKQVDAQLRNEFKAVCARRGVTMREVILELIRKEVEKDKRSQKK